MSGNNPVRLVQWEEAIGDWVPVDDTYPLPVTNINGANSVSFVQYADSGSIDAFARLRVSNPFTLFDSKQIWNDPDLADNIENFPLFWDNQEVSGTGTSTTFNVNRASTTLSVANLTAGKRVRQSKQRFNYQPGKSMLIILTGMAGNTSTGVIKELGYFDDNDGLFYRATSSTWSVVIRSNATGSPVDTVIPQASWNIDTMDGTGPSGITLDPTKTQILFLDFEWLGVGRVRFGFFVDGLPYYVHEVLNANNLDVVYMSNPNLPIRFSIENDGTGGIDTVEQICSTVISEGGVQSNGTFRGGDLGGLAASEIQADIIGTTYAVCGIRLKSAYLSAIVREASFSMIETSGANNPFLWKVHFNPTLTTGLTWSNVSQSSIQFGTGLPAGDVITDDGYVIQSGYVDRSAGGVQLPLGSALRIGSAIDGTVDELILSVTPITTNQDVFGSLNWIEVW